MNEDLDQWGYPVIEPIRNPDNEADDYDQWGYLILCSPFGALLCAILLAATLSSCTADQQARFTAGYYGETGHTFSQAMSDTLASGLRGAGNYAQGYSNAYQSYYNPYQAPPHGSMMVITPGGGTSFIYY